MTLLFIIMNREIIYIPKYSLMHPQIAIFHILAPTPSQNNLNSLIFHQSNHFPI